MTQLSQKANTMPTPIKPRRFLHRAISAWGSGVACLLLTLPSTAQADNAPTGAGSPPASPQLGYSPANMDPRAKPRQDFYRYANGTWLDHTQIPASEGDLGGFSELSINLDKQLLKLIKDSASAQGEPGSARQQIGAYWLAAMDLKRLDEVGLAPLQADLERVTSLAWPALPAALGEL